MRRHLSYANVMATLAFFFALTGGAMAVGKYVMTTDPIPATSDLTGTYGNPLIADGKVTTPKLADGAVTSGKLAQSARRFAVVGIGGEVKYASSPDIHVLHTAGENEYSVIFPGAPSFMTGCALVASSWVSRGTAKVTGVGVGGGHGLVGVETFDANGAPIEDAFSLLAVC
jgi:hypothetical protein